jgi:hypothetical protein
MKKLFIGLLVVGAATTGILLFLNQQNKPPTNPSFTQEMIVGDWRLDSLGFKDSTGEANILASLNSNLVKYQFRFTKDSTLLISIPDSAVADTSKYLVNKDNQLIVFHDAKGLFTDSLKINVLNKDSLVAFDKDSTALFFTKAK